LLKKQNGNKMVQIKESKPIAKLKKGKDIFIERE